MDSRPENSPAQPLREAKLPEPCLDLARRCFAEAEAERWQLSFQVFQGALARSAAKRFGGSSFTAAQFEDYALGLHLHDLALACACSEGSESAWEEFFSQFRGYLRAAAAAILRCAPSDSTAIEFADSLFADLYGLAGRDAPSRSLFRYFHGRSSLKTWLRAVLAQRHVDRIRAARKFDSLDEPPDGEARRVREPATQQPPPDPRRGLYLERFEKALADALASLDERDRSRLQLYYGENRTLAEIGRLIGEHESSVSRNLERVRRELRATVEELLRAKAADRNGEAGFDDAQIALAVQYAAEDAAIDLEKLFNPSKLEKPAGRNPEVKP